MTILSFADHDGVNNEKKARTIYSNSNSNSKETSESFNEFMENREKSDKANDEDAMPPSLQTFLAHFGVLSPSSHEGGDGHTSTSPPSHSWNSVIFESSFDLTEERLRFIFDMLDSAKTGRISYESLRRGLEMHSSSGGTSSHPSEDAAGIEGQEGPEADAPPPHHPLHLSQKSFDKLVEILDVDKSRDITFQEFSQGLRYLMLRALFPQTSADSTTGRISNRVEATIEVLDYDSQHLERSIVVDDAEFDPKATKSARVTATSAAARAIRRSNTSSYAYSTVSQISTTDFYFHDRPPKWVNMRWINVSGAKSSITLKRLAVRYKLHPLALEDALSPEQHRPKAEDYSNRK